MIKKEFYAFKLLVSLYSLELERQFMSWTMSAYVSAPQILQSLKMNDAIHLQQKRYSAHDC